MPTSQNGFAVLTSSSKLLHNWEVPGVDSDMLLRHGSAGFNLIFLMSLFDDRVEDVDGNYVGGRDDWAYAYRAVRGYSDWSNHASGTAIDLNATDHPLGKVGTFSDAEVMVIHRILRARFLPAGAAIPAIRWGGDYRNRKDEMHFECALSLPYQEQIARKLMKSPRGKLILDANPGQAKVILS